MRSAYALISITAITGGGCCLAWWPQVHWQQNDNPTSDLLLRLLAGNTRESGIEPFKKSSSEVLNLTLKTGGSSH
jgi:hypothetical protein